MKTFFFILLAAVIGGCAYGYYHNPAECQKLASDLQADAPLVVADVKTICGAPADAVPTAQATTSTTASSWVAPTTFPSQPNWTWTTSEGTYQSVHIIKVEPDVVTILHLDGSATVPISELPTDLQAKLNYDPAAAKAYAEQRSKADQGGTPLAAPGAPAGAVASANAPSGTPAPAVAKSAPRFLETTSYNDALAEAKRSGWKVLLHFTGSDWCPYCKLLDSEVLETNTYYDFAKTHFITVTLDFPHDTQLSDDLKQQNLTVARKYAVDSYPTLLVTDSDGKELGRVSGYNPGSGPDAVIASLKPYSN